MRKSTTILLLLIAAQSCLATSDWEYQYSSVSLARNQLWYHGELMQDASYLSEEVYYYSSVPGRYRLQAGFLQGRMQGTPTAYQNQSVFFTLATKLNSNYETELALFQDEGSLGYDSSALLLGLNYRLHEALQMRARSGWSSYSRIIYAPAFAYEDELMHTAELELDLSSGKLGLTPGLLADWYRGDRAAAGLLRARGSLGRHFSLQLLLLAGRLHHWFDTQRLVAYTGVSPLERVCSMKLIWDNSRDLRLSLATGWQKDEQVESHWIWLGVSVYSGRWIMKW